MVRKKSRQTSNDSHRVATTDDIEVSTYLGIAKEIGGELPAAAEEAVSGAEREAVVVIDFGSQYSMLIARRVRECQVYCELLPHDTPWEKIAPLNPKGFIFSGGPASVYDPKAPLAPAYIYGKCPEPARIAIAVEGLAAMEDNRESAAVSPLGYVF